MNDGVYNQAQWRRGSEAFVASCELCHRVADFSGADYMRVWNGVNLRVFRGMISSTMPQNAANTLTPQQYTDIVAYVLGVSGYPAGAEELPIADESLEEVTIVPARAN